MTRTNLREKVLGQLEQELARMSDGQRLPSEQELAKRYHVSKPTLRHALDDLVARGHLRKINGVGIVLEQRPQTLTRSLGLVCHNLGFFANTLQAFAETAAAANYRCAITPLVGDAVNQERCLATAIAEQPAGLLVYTDPQQRHLASYERLADMGLPTVYLMRLPTGVAGNLVTFGNNDGLSGIVRQLYDDGARRFAFYSDDPGNPTAEAERLDGFRNGLRRVRLKATNALICDSSAGNGERTAFFERCLDPQHQPDAICCVNDGCAGRVMRRLQGLNAKLADFRFTGFDNAPLNDFLPRPILTAVPPLAALGSCATSLLIRQIENPTIAPSTKKLAAEIRSTG